MLTDSRDPQRLLDRAVKNRDYVETSRLIAEDPTRLFPKLWYPAILVGDLDMCRLLLQNGLDPNESGSDRKPLHFAAEQGKTEIVRLLLDFGADPNVKDASGLTPLDQCCEFGSDAANPGLIDLFVKAGAEMPFATCLRIGDIDRVREFLDSNPELLNLPLASAVGTPLMVASRCGRADIIADLLHRGAEVNEIAELADLRTTGHGRNTALWYAAQGRRKGRGPVAKLLIEAGADLNFVGENGETPLHVASAWDHPDVAEVLLRAGADPNILTLRGDSPLDYAIRWEFKEVESVLRQFGGKPFSLKAVVAGIE